MAADNKLDVPRQWYVSEALSSWRKLNELLPNLTENELKLALEIECGSRRRTSVQKRLSARIVLVHQRNKGK